MNKEKLIKELESMTGLENEKCIIINHILENHFLIGKNNKEKIISDMIEQLELTKEEAKKIYEVAMSIIGTGIKNKLMHPFGSGER